ncbi:hypothetical protein K0C01_10450 [Salinarchaeum sp. IM2453]|uniref:hypothetical protein n=1 Tax=Salinarchaeum sp. IM2453 TaxID=2862870 RepID=UPI001C82EB6F|nr:hypothetical protein [Salinarchaeum sp. IM2453]QZA88197.1 hypothetical protein K0C01_10450 [Salinarchaeum sp. IM2453]
MSENKTSSWIGATRVLVGLLLAYELAFGGWWKLNTDWIGIGAGGPLAARAARAVSDGTYIWYSVILETVVIPYAWVWSNLALALQLLFALALLFGFWTRPAAVIGVLYFMTVFNMGTIRTSPTFAVAIAFLLVTNAGYHYGLDAWIRQQSGKWAQWSDRIASFGSISRSRHPYIAASAALIGLYYLLTIPERGYAFADGLALVGVELTLLSAVVAGGFALAYRGANVISLAADGLRVFIGYRLLHEVFVRIDPGVNTLPGWAPLESQEAVFTDIAAAHISPVTIFIEAVILPILPAWVIFFAVIQTVSGIALFIGYRTRLFGFITVGYLVMLIALGFVRLAPLLLMSAIPAATLGGRYASIDSINGRSQNPMTVTFSQLPVSSQTMLYGLSVISVVFVVVGLVLGVEPSGYRSTTGQISLVMIGFTIAALVFGAQGFSSPEQT